jgi:acyl carrier protein
MLPASPEPFSNRDAVDRIRECLLRAGLARVPAGEEEDLAGYGLDSLISVLMIIEMQKEFGIVISTGRIRPGSFQNMRSLLALLPESM